MLGSRFDLSETLNDIAAQRSVRDDGEVDCGRDVGAQQGASAPKLDHVEALLAEASHHELVSRETLDLRCIEVEQEMIAMARTLHSKHPKVSFRCPVCDSRMHISDEKALSEFGELNVKLHELECTTCGMLTGRVFHPTVGYHTLVR